jgi:hypothetical protein
MVYDWENKEEICYRMYIEEKKSLEEIMDYMKEHHKFTPRYAAARTSPYRIHTVVRTDSIKQTRLPDPVQAMGFPLQAKSCPQECRPRPASQGAMGLQYLPTGDAPNP